MYVCYSYWKSNCGALYPIQRLFSCAPLVIVASGKSFQLSLNLCYHCDYLIIANTITDFCRLNGTRSCGPLWRVTSISLKLFSTRCWNGTIHRLESPLQSRRSSYSSSYYCYITRHYITLPFLLLLLIIHACRDSVRQLQIINSKDSVRNDFVIVIIFPFHLQNYHLYIFVAISGCCRVSERHCSLQPAATMRR